MNFVVLSRCSVITFEYFLTNKRNKQSFVVDIPDDGVPSSVKEAQNAIREWDKMLQRYTPHGLDGAVTNRDAYGS